MAEGRNAHYDVFFYFFLARMKIIQHYCFKWLQKNSLKTEIFSFFFFQEFI
jgi:hypothetical protein